eukprot:TRINITY_DN12627_c0_g1_i1.p1 TRINITY_DN12627_c0_g1~~TRINITY_DN12627_c0_g1_i1.p1  ORF type:complete len:224 (+),score=33.03 TRINITY_DN12627_c0_g1_i1:58-729(+)
MNLLQLPVEVLLHICGMLDLQNILRLRHCNKHFAAVLVHEPLWRHLCVSIGITERSTDTWSHTLQSAWQWKLAGDWFDRDSDRWSFSVTRGQVIPASGTCFSDRKQLSAFHRFVLSFAPTEIAVLPRITFYDSMDESALFVCYVASPGYLLLQNCLRTNKGLQPRACRLLCRTVSQARSITNRLCLLELHAPLDLYAALHREVIEPEALAGRNKTRGKRKFAL